MIPKVFFVINFSIFSGFILKVLSMSQKTGLAPTLIIAFAVDIKLFETVIIS